MEIHSLHDWDLTTEEARETQKNLARKVIYTNFMVKPRLIAGLDVSVSRFNRAGRAAVVLLGYPSLDLVEMETAEGEIRFPYVPGLLSFREVPLVLEACRKLTCKPDLILVDGQGIAHPRRFGIASHIGLLLNIPTIGCAKSRLIGMHDTVPDEVGKYSYLVDNDEIIGAAVRTRRGVNPIYISIGHKVDLPTAIHWSLKCCKGYRLPEPTRFAHLAANGGLVKPSVMQQI